MYSGIYFVFIPYTAFLIRRIKWLPLVSRKMQYHVWQKLILEQKLEFIYIYTAEYNDQYVVVNDETEHTYPLLPRHSLKLPKRSTINSYLSAAYDEG